MIVLIVVEIEFDTLIVPQRTFPFSMLFLTSKSNDFPKSKVDELIQI